MIADNSPDLFKERLIFAFRISASDAVLPPLRHDNYRILFGRLNKLQNIGRTFSDAPSPNKILSDRARSSRLIRHSRADIQRRYRQKIREKFISSRKRVRSVTEYLQGIITLSFGLLREPFHCIRYAQHNWQYHGEFSRRTAPRAPEDAEGMAGCLNPGMHSDGHS